MCSICCIFFSDQFWTNLAFFLNNKLKFKTPERVKKHCGMSSIKDDLMGFTLAVWRNPLNADPILRDTYIIIYLFYICSENDSGHWLTVFPAFDPDIALLPDRPWAASSFSRQALWSVWECASVTCLLCRFTFTPQSLCSVRRCLEIHYNLKLWIQNEAFDEINVLYESVLVVAELKEIVIQNKWLTQVSVSTVSSADSEFTS